MLIKCLKCLKCYDYSRIINKIIVNLLDEKSLKTSSKNALKVFFMTVICSIISIILIQSCKKENPTPLPTLPVLNTTAATEITQTTATSGGEVTSDGGSPVIARGICWTTTTDPTISNNKTTETGGSGVFTSSITQLTQNTKYYLRAYATNIAGTGYGTTESFTTVSIGVAPVLPPSASILIDFSNFTTQKSIEDSYWKFATTTADVWRILMATTLAVPVASFKLAVDQTPTYVADKTWQWSYNATVATVLYKTRLTGQIRTSDVLWKMYITKEGTGGFAEFLWLEGTSKTDGTGGQWIINQSSQIPEAMLQIDWTKTGTSIGSVKYTFIKNLDPFKSSYIEYGLTTAALNAFYTIHYYDGVKFSDVKVEWNTTTKNGRVKSVDFLLGEWYCWDANKINTVCL